MEGKKKQFTKDEIREIILKFLYEKRKKARSLKKIGATIGEIKNELKKFGLKENEIVDNLDFLIKNQLILEKKENIKLPKQRIEVTVTRYELSNTALHYLEPSSKFDFTEKFSGLVFKNIKDSIIVVGHGNIIQNKFGDIYKYLEDLKLKILLSDIPDDKKVNYIADIETIKAQLAKKDPDKNIIKRAWEGIKELSSIGGLSQLLNDVWMFIKNLLK